MSTEAKNAIRRRRAAERKISDNMALLITQINTKSLPQELLDILASQTTIMTEIVDLSGLVL